MALVVIMRPELKHGGSTRFMYAFHEKKKKERKKNRTMHFSGPWPGAITSQTFSFARDS